MAFPIRALLEAPPPRLHICDVGAMTHGLGSEPHHRLIAAGLARLTGFEPDDDERAKAAAAYGPDHRILPHYVGRGGPARFHRCAMAMTSSLYPPDDRLLAHFQKLAGFTRVVAVSDVETVRLDDIAAVADTDFLKIDVQGAEADVLDGAPELLKNAVVVQAEVCFVALYRGQALFADVDRRLRRAGFQFHRFTDLAGRAFKPLMVKQSGMTPLSQVLWTDAVYVKDFMTFDSLAPDRLLALAMILHEVYRSYDLAHLALAARDRQAGTTLAGAYLHRLTTG